MRGAPGWERAQGVRHGWVRVQLCRQPRIIAQQYSAQQYNSSTCLPWYCRYGALVRYSELYFMEKTPAQLEEEAKAQQPGVGGSAWGRDGAGWGEAGRALRPGAEKGCSIQGNDAGALQVQRGCWVEGQGSDGTIYCSGLVAGVLREAWC